MARPKKDGMDYFPHDTDTSSEEKIEALEAVHGLVGYAVYFKLLERIYRNSFFELDLSNEITISVLLKKWSLSRSKFDSIINTTLELDLFDREIYNKRKCLTSNGVKKRSKVVIDKREDMKRKYETQKYNYKNEENCGVSDAETIPETTQELTNNTPESTQSKVKESKVKESKVKEDSAPAKAVRENNNFISQLLEIFKTEYKKNRGFEFETDTPKKETSALGKMVSGYKEKHPDKNTNDSIEYFREFFIKCLKIEDKFLYKTMSPSIILNQKPQISAIINGNKNGGIDGRPRMADLSFMGITNESRPKPQIDFSTV